MIRVDELIQEFCLDGVQYLNLGEVVAYSNTRIDASTLNGETFVGVDNLLPNKAGRTDATYSPNTARLTAYETGDILLGNIRPYLKKVWLATNSGGCSGDVLAIRVAPHDNRRLTPEFLYYLLSSDDFFRFNMQHAKGAKMPRGSKSAILKYRIPLPPIEVQNEIVKILDKFVQLEEELSAELEARRKQYQFYRHSLMTFTDDIIVMKLAQVADFINAKPHEKLVDPEGDVALITSKFVSTQGKSARRIMSENVLTPAYTDDIALVMSDLPNGRALARAYFVKEDNKYAANQRVCLLRTIDKNKIIPKFLYYSVNRNKQLLKYDSGFDQTHLKKDWIININIHVPPIAEQARIVQILDSFEELTSGLSHGLPAELNARREQYEYYRTKLLTFQELPS